MQIDRPGISDYEGKGVYYFVKDKRPFRGKKILIVGGGDTAVDWCLNLKDWAGEITLIHRRDHSARTKRRLPRYVRAVSR